jgi:hypothetical protein
MSTGYYIACGYIYGPGGKWTKYYILDGQLHGPSGSPRAWLGGNYIYCDSGNTNCYIQDNSIYGDKEKLPWSQKG